MDQKFIISFENGTLYLRLREKITHNEKFLSVSSGIARIDRDGLEVALADSRLTANATQMILSAEELALISEGFQMVHDFWHESLLPHGHVLFDCGCIIKWDEYSDKDLFEKIGKGRNVWCPDHEEATIYRVNDGDFK